VRKQQEPKIHGLRNEGGPCPKYEHRETEGREPKGLNGARRGLVAGRRRLWGESPRKRRGVIKLGGGGREGNDQKKA